MSSDLAAAIVELRREEVLAAVSGRAAKGEDPLQILEECRRGMTTVGERFQKGDYFLAELMLSAEIFKEAMTVLRPHLAKSRPTKPLAKIVIATLKGDIHNLGKDIMATLLEAHGFEVHDLGVDVPPSLVLAKVREIKPQFVGFSALITTAFPNMREAAEMMREAGLRQDIKLMIGGGVTTATTKEYVGADFQTTDAMAGVAYCLSEMEGRRR